MKRDGYYTSGQFANMAHVTKKTLRYYDEHNILKPSVVLENGTRYYTDNDFARLQQIIFLKYLSFPLADIKELTVRSADRELWMESLKLQTNLLEEHIEQMTLMKRSLQEAQEAIAEGREVNWSDMLLLANSNEMEQKLKRQYINSSNISARISLHNDYSLNQEGWFPWLYRMTDLKPGERVLELGCGDGAFWLQNVSKLPENVDVLLTDISDGIVRETGKKLDGMAHFACRVMDAHYINAEDGSYDVVIANHMLFYCEDLGKVFAEIKRVLKPGGRLICSTYGATHMQEISNLVREFDDRIALSADVLYERFGKENGAEILKEYFGEVNWQQFEDGLLVTKPEPLVAYILSCHGNQNRYIVDKYHEFTAFVKKKTEKGFRITKDAGVFVATVEG
ncbi:MAG: methyltransferase domain-containing protein [Acetatifactor sp.]|nr:methyltransferase domain-containing protein [Acetatifactor sp.]